MTNINITYTDFEQLLGLIWIRNKNKYCQVATNPSSLNFDRIPQSRMVIFFFTKMTNKNDPTISCSQLMAELCILVGWEKKKKEKEK